MKHYRIVLAITALVVASLACNAVTGARNNNENPAPTAESGGSESGGVQPTAESNNPGSSGSDSTTSTDFPKTSDAYNVTEQGGTLIYFTKLSLKDAMQFYRDQYTARGYKEREILTVTSDNTFNIVFDGDPSGQSVVVQSVDLGNGSRTITVRLEAITP